MYTNEDLNNAVKQGIFSKDSVSAFRNYQAKTKNSTIADEENFRLISGFNDIFVVIASGLLVFSLLYILKPINATLAYAVFTVSTWLLAEFFVRKRKMALPAVLLLLAFMGGSFALGMSLFSGFVNAQTFSIAALFSAGAGFLHWLRFKVPITVAVGVLALGVTFTIVLFKIFFPEVDESTLRIAILVQGLVVFVLAMYWDSADKERITSKSDSAFWLHLLAAPLIIHPVFYSLGMLDRSGNLQSVFIVIALYLLMTFISLVIDRRAFMVSSLIYVLYAFSNLIKEYGGIDYGFALTGVFIGGLLVLLSANWYKARKLALVWLPIGLKKHLPESN